MLRKVLFSALLCMTVFTQAVAGQFSFRLEEISALPETAWAPVGLYLEGTGSVAGFSVEVTYVPSDLTFVCAHLPGGVLGEQSDPVVVLENDPEHGLVHLQADLSEPVLLNGEEVRLLDVVFALDGGIPPGTAFPLGFAGDPVVDVQGTQVRGNAKDGQVSIPDENILLFSETEAAPGQHRVEVVMKLFNRDPVQGLQVSCAFDNSVLKLTEITVEGTDTAELQAEFFEPIINNTEGYFVVGILLQEKPPVDFTRRYPVSGYQLSVLRCFFDVSPDAEPNSTAAVRFVDGFHTPPIQNRLVVDFQSVPPTVMDGVIHIRGVAFLRGNPNQDHRVNIADPIRILQYLFLQYPLDCQKTADVNDDGEISFDDTMYLLHYLFNFGPTVPEPFPEQGMDPTPDNLTCERYRGTPAIQPRGR